MPRSEPAPAPVTVTDWRGWLALVWVAWFGLLYGQMVVAQRGGKVRAMLRPAAVHTRP
jgi:hypothetical protein